MKMCQMGIHKAKLNAPPTYDVALENETSKCTRVLLTTCSRAPSSALPNASWKNEPAVQPKVITRRKSAAKRQMFVRMEQIKYMNVRTVNMT